MQLPRLILLPVFTFLFSFWFLFTLLSPVFAASPGEVVINEVVTDPQQDWGGNNFTGVVGSGTSSYVDEWIELLIKKDNLDLTGWTIKLLDGTDVTGSLNPAGAFETSRYIGEGSFTNTKPSDFLVLGNVKGSGQMNNDIQIVLKDNSGNVIDQVTLGNWDNGGSRNAPSGNSTGINDEVVARDLGGTDTDYDANDFRKGSATLGLMNNPFPTPTPTMPPTPTPTPNPTSTPTLTNTPTPTKTPTPTITPTPTLAPSSYPSTVKLSEFMPNPSSGNPEWVKLYNQGDEAVDLSGWKIDDIEGGSSPYTIEEGTIIAAKSSSVFYFSSSKLNNDGDSVRLLDPIGAVSDSTSYTSSTAGRSYFKDETGSWRQQTDSPTPSSTPTPARPSATPIVKNHGTIASLKKLTSGSPVELEAEIIVPLNLLGKNILYVADGSGGIRVKTKNDPGTLNLGDRVKIASYITESFEESLVQTETVGKLGSVKPQDRVRPKSIKIGEIGEAYEGSLIRVVGQISETSGSTFYLTDDGVQRTKIYLKDSTGIKLPRKRTGDYAAVVGVLSQYGFSDDETPNYRILPRFAVDILISAEPIGEGEVLGISTLPKTGHTLDEASIIWLKRLSAYVTSKCKM